MAVISKDLGAVTAYAAAVNRGYTGTKEEFETLMASYATVAQQAQASATSAGQSATDASGSAQTAQLARQGAEEAQTLAEEAQTQARGSAQSAQASAQDAQGYAQTAESAKNTAIDTVDGFAAGAQQALDSVNSAGINWKSLAQAKALDSEAYALGTRDSEDVGSSDPAYHNNAKYYADSVGSSAQTATEAAQTATAKASEAQASASAAAESARTLTIDPTLTQAGQAADAFETGNKITSLKDAFDGLNNDVNNISGSVPIRPAEIGWAYISNGQIAYASSANGARLKKGWFLSLKQGDVIYTDNSTLYDFRGGYSTDAGNTWTDISWKAQTSFSIPVTGIYIFTFRDKNNNITNLDQHLSHFTIVRDSGILKQIESCLVEENGEWEE